MNTHIANRLADLSLLWRVIVACCLVCVPAAPAAAQTPVTTCGQTLTTPGQLVGDLDCTAYDGTAAILLLGTSIDFAGHVMSVGPAVVDAIRCSPPCEIHSTAPGAAILGPSETGIAIRDQVGKRNVVSDLVIDGPATGIWGDYGTYVDATRVRVANCSDDGIRVSHVRLTEGEVANNGGFGIDGGYRPALDVRSSWIHDNLGPGLNAYGTGSNGPIGRIKLRESMVSGNGSYNVGGHSVKIADSEIDGGSGSGVRCRLCRLLRVSISGAGSNGFEGYKSIKIRDSEMTGNGGHGVTASYSTYRPGQGSLRLFRTAIRGNGEHGLLYGGNGTLSMREVIVEGNLGHGVEVDRGKATIVETAIAANNLVGFHRPGVSYCGADLTRIADSTIQGNSLDPDCGVGTVCVDIATCDRPALSGTVCDTSYDTSSGTPGLTWDVCSLD